MGCLECGEDFAKKLSDAVSNHKFCSAECQKAYEAEKAVMNYMDSAIKEMELRPKL